MASCVLSLKNMTIAKIAISLWAKLDVTHICLLNKRSHLQKFDVFLSPLDCRTGPLLPDDRHREWEQLASKVLANVKFLQLPVFLQVEILGFVEQSSVEIKNWFEYHVDFYGETYVKKSISKLLLTSNGKVDLVRTAKLVIKDDSLDIICRYETACIYCLENDVATLWTKIPEERQAAFYGDHPTEGVTWNSLVLIWTYLITGDLERLNRFMEKKPFHFHPFEYAFEYAIATGNKPAAVYFLRKVPEDKKFNLFMKKCINYVEENNFFYSYDGHYSRRFYYDVKEYLNSLIKDILGPLFDI